MFVLAEGYRTDLGVLARLAVVLLSARRASPRGASVSRADAGGDSPRIGGGGEKARGRQGQEDRGGAGRVLHGDGGEKDRDVRGDARRAVAV